MSDILIPHEYYIYGPKDKGYSVLSLLWACPIYLDHRIDTLSLACKVLINESWQEQGVPKYVCRRLDAA